MNRKKWIPVACAAILATGVAGGAAFAHGAQGETSDAALLANSKVTLTEAIAAAEQQTGGKAIDAGFDNENGAARIAVDVADKQGVKTVLVDPQTGHVTATRPADEGEGHETDN